MNFEHYAGDPLEVAAGYPLVLSITVGLCLGIHRTLKRNGWGSGTRPRAPG